MPKEGREQGGLRGPDQQCSAGWGLPKTIPSLPLALYPRGPLFTSVTVVPPCSTAQLQYQISYVTLEAHGALSL